MNVEVSQLKDISSTAPSVAVESRAEIYAESVLPSDSPTNISESREIRTRKVYTNVVYCATKVFHVLEYIGECVAHMIGLNESRYQWVLDTMDEDDWAVARAVQAKRDREDAITDEAKSVSQLEGGCDQLGVACDDSNNVSNSIAAAATTASVAVSSTATTLTAAGNSVTTTTADGATATATASPVTSVGQSNAHPAALESTN